MEATQGNGNKGWLVVAAPILGVVAGWLGVNVGGLEAPAGVCLGIAV